MDKSFQLFSVFIVQGSERVSERSGARQRSEQRGASEEVSGRAIGPLQTSRIQDVTRSLLFRKRRKHTCFRVLRVPIAEATKDPLVKQFVVSVALSFLRADELVHQLLRVAIFSTI